MEKPQQKKRIQLSFIIRDPIEKLNRSGVNCLRYDSKLDRLYSAGRDSIIRLYNASDKNEPYSSSLSHHTDWVNDIVLCNNGNTLFSASSDTTVKVWNLSKSTHLNTLTMHKDYVKCLAYAKDKELIASAGFDKTIYMWDAHTTLNTSTIKVTSINDNKYSIYSLAINNQGTLISSGSPENCIRIWDTRTCTKIIKLKGHTHNIRSLLINKDGTQLLSASSDHTIRLWSIGQQRCIATIDNLHTQGVWSLCVNDGWTHVFSGGNDAKLYLTDLRNIENSLLVCQETSPILSIEYGKNQESIWVSTMDSDIKNWSLKNLNKKSDSEFKSYNSNGVEEDDEFHSILKPLNDQPDQIIKGASSIKQYRILNDKRFIVTKDSDENVAIYDVLKARKVEDLGKENYENVIKARQKYIYVPNWFTVDLKLGLLTINLDESDCLSAWLNYNKETSDIENNFVSEQFDNKINYGCLLLEALLRNFPLATPQHINNNNNLINNNDDQQLVASHKTTTTTTTTTNSGANANSTTNGGVHVPEHTTIVFSEVAGRTLHRVECKDISREPEQKLMNILPLWIIDPLINKNLPKFIKIVFLLNPYPTNSNSKVQVNKDRLTSIDLLTVKKIKEHVYSKILKLNESGTTSTSHSNDHNDTTYQGTLNSSSNGDNKTNQDQLINIADRTIEIICSEQVLNDPDMDLRTIKHLVWKGCGDLLLNYRVKT